MKSSRLHSQLDGIVQEAEDLQQEQDLSSSKVSVSIDQINAIYAQMTKIDESLIDKMPNELIKAEMIDASNYGDKIVTLTQSEALQFRTTMRPMPRA